MKKITKSFFTLLLLMVAGLAYAQKPTEVADLSKDMYHVWVGVEADATVADPDEPGCGVNLNTETDCPYGNTGVPKEQFADLSEWDYLTLVVTSDNPRLFFNDGSEGGGRLTVLTSDATYVVSNEEGVIVYDLAAIKAARGFVHLNAIKASAWNTKAVVAEMKLAKGAPYKPVKAEVADLTKEMYHKWVGVEADASIADPDEFNCGVNLNVETDCPYGNTGVPKDEFADLSEWDYLTLVVTSDNPRLFFNDSSEDGGRITIATKNNPENYLENKGDGVYVIDLSAIKEAHGFVHLNAIKASAWNTKSVVSEMKLATVEPYIPVAATTYAITITEAENGVVTADVEEAAEGDKVTLTITPSEGYELDALSVTAGETAVEVAEDNTFTMPAADVTVTATFKAKEGEPEPEPAVANRDLSLDLFHLWTNFDADATIADPDNNSGVCVVNAETGCPYGDSNVGELQFADLSAWDYLTLVVTSDAPRLFFNAKSQSDRISVLPNDEKYLISKDEGVYVYDLAAIKADAGYVHLNAIKASAWNTQIVVSEMKLTLAEPEHEVADLAKDMFHKWTGFDAEAAVADPDENGGAVNLNAETDCPYGNTNVTEYEYADLSAWDYLTLVVTSDAPRLFFNSKGGNDRITVLPNDEKYLISKDEGVYVYDLAAIKADAGFVHLNSIKASAYNTKTIVTEMKLATVEPYIPEAAGEETTYAITITEAENGVVTADVEEAAEGDKVTLTITPSEGYELDALSVTAGETAVEVAEDNTFTMPAADVTVNATFKEKEGEPEPEPEPVEEYLPAPDLTDFIEIAQAQEEPADSGNPLADIEEIEVEGVPVTNYTTKEGVCVVFKMQNVDVSNSDYITIKFAQPTPEGLSISFWGGIKAIDLPAGVDHYDYVYDDPKAESEIANDIIPQISIISIYKEAGKKLSVYGVYKHVVAPELAYTDLTKEMFFQWSDWTNGEATAQANCEYKVGESTGQPYGDPSVNNYADLSEYATLEVTTTEGAPRFLFNRDVKEGQWSETEADSHLIDNTKGGWSTKYFSTVDNGDGTTTYVVDIVALVADKGYAHLHGIKGANWQDVTVTDMKLGYVGEEPVIPVPTNIFEVADDVNVKDGKYIENGQIVIVKGGKKYTVNGVELK